MADGRQPQALTKPKRKAIQASSSPTCSVGPLGGRDCHLLTTNSSVGTCRATQSQKRELQEREAGLEP